MKLNKTLIAATAAFALCASAGAAFARSELQPGIGSGIPVGMAYPEALYLTGMPTYSTTPTYPIGPVDTSIFPLWLIWSTPFELLGGKIEFDAASGGVHASNGTLGLNKTWISNTLLAADLKWDFGNGFHAGIGEILWLPGGTPNDYGFFSFSQSAAITYFKDGWNLTATGVFGTGQNGNIPGHYAPNWVNIDLTATHFFGKWEAGLIAFGSSDLSTPYNGYRKQSQFAVGGLIGYHMGLALIQVKLSRDVTEANYGGYETRLQSTITVPLWITEKPTVPVAAKY